MDRDELIPKEIISDAPRVTLTGQERVHVEQHKGLIAYQMEEVVFRVATGRLTVRGQELRFRRYTAGEAILTGRVDSVTIAGGEKSV